MTDLMREGTLQVGAPVQWEGVVYERGVRLNATFTGGIVSIDRDRVTVVDDETGKQYQLSIHGLFLMPVVNR